MLLPAEFDVRVGQRKCGDGARSESDAAFALRAANLSARGFHTHGCAISHVPNRQRVGFRDNKESQTAGTSFAMASRGARRLSPKRDSIMGNHRELRCDLMDNLPCGVSQMSKDTLPSVVEEFSRRQPAVWEAYNQLGEAVSAAGPLDPKIQRLLKLAIAIGAGREGAVRSHARRGLRAGLTREELEQTALLGITTAGWPAAFAARCWIEEEVVKAQA